MTASSATPTLDELRDLHRRSTPLVIQSLLKGMPIPAGWWLYSENGRSGTNRLLESDLKMVFSDTNNSPELAVIAMSKIAKSYLVNGGAVRNELAKSSSPLPRAVILIVPPPKSKVGEVVKTFVLTEHQVFLAKSPVGEDGKAVKLADLKLWVVPLKNNHGPSNLNGMGGKEKKKGKVSGGI